MRVVVRYLASLDNARIALWCYFLWYLGTVVVHFDPSPALWWNAFGIAVLVGIALVLAVGGFATVRRAPRQTFRLFAMPFCVSSFAALIKDRGFLLVLPPTRAELGIDLALCVSFVLFVLLARHATLR